MPFRSMVRGAGVGTILRTAARRPTIALWASLAILLALTAVANLTPRAFANAPSATGRFVDRIYRDAQGEHKYVVFEPAGYHPGKKWPLIFYLHGASGRGVDGKAQLIVGMGPAVKQRAATLPFLVVFPQNENLRSRLLGGWHEHPEELDRALRILDAVEKDYSVDTKHEVLVGTSMGGFGVWSLAARTPERWRAVVPISGGGHEDMIPALAKVPVWAFHALDDTLVPPEASTSLVEGIRRAGGRAYVSLLPQGGHNISRAVLARDEVFEWFLHPEREPRLDIDWTEQRDLPNMLDQMPFYPAAEVAGAVRVHVGRDLLESWAALMPSLIPAESLQGYKGGSVETSQMGPFSFNVVVGGIGYTGTLERAWMEPLPGNRLRLQLGLRALQMTVYSTQLRGRLFSADAGPMAIYIGYREPVWLTAEIAPRISHRRLHLDLLGVSFQIPPDNWSIAPPSHVRVRGLPFLRNRVTEGLVEGLAEKRPVIEAEIRNSVPLMLARIEQQISEANDRVVSFGRWPMPLWQPRFKFYPEALLINEQGLDLHLGAVVAQLGKRPDGAPYLRFHEPEPWSAPPPDGLQLAISQRVVAAWSTLLADSNVARFHVLDMNSPLLHELGRRAFWNEVLPAMRDLPEHTELQTEFTLLEPLRLRNRGGNQVTTSPQSEMGIVIPKMRLDLAVREPAHAEWRPWAAFDLSFEQGLKVSVARPSFVRRELHMSLIPADMPQVTPSLLPPGVSAADVDTRRLAAQFAQGWADNFHLESRTAVLSDWTLAKLPLRWHDVGWNGAQLLAEWRRPGIRVVNALGTDVVYRVRGMTTQWSEPYRLGPGEFHVFRPTTAILWIPADAPHVTPFQLSLGESIEIRPQGPVSVVPATGQLVGGTR
uniref:Phospholipase/carboxylesterase/thioesterase domain-containing protein n=1 Tax=Schlesneria paludicola TaxID=360056 RepID=A0A7C4LKI5_9PLAN